jgi:hypothetical protein
MILKGARQGRKQKIERQLLVCKSTLLNKTYMGLIFFRMFRACPPVHTFCQTIKGYKDERKHKNKKTASCPHFHTFELLSTCLFSRISELLSTCPHFLQIL